MGSGVGPERCIELGDKALGWVGRVALEEADPGKTSLASTQYFPQKRFHS